jgi:hypothetical protein
MIYKCPECDKTFKTGAGLGCHWAKEHSLKEENIDKVKEITENIIKSLPKLKRLSPPVIKKGKLKKESWVLMLSDFHYGQLVKPVEVGGFSEYNPGIAKERIELLAGTVIRMLEYHPNRPEELVITALGDMVDGSILRGNQQSNIEFGVCRQVIEAVEILADFIILLSAHFPIIRFYGVYGNHARLTPNPKDAPPQENFDLLMYHFIKQRLGNLKGITIDYTEAQHMIVQVAKHNLWLEHGDTVKGWSGYPYYGADREKNNIMSILSMFREEAHYLLMGHHHRLSFFNNIIGNGSFVGGDLFSIGKLRRMGIAEQMLFSINEKHGLVWTRPIKLSSPVEGKLKIYK